MLGTVGIAEVGECDPLDIIMGHCNTVGKINYDYGGMNKYIIL